MIHNTKQQAPALKQCRIIYNNKSHEFKTSRFEELKQYIKDNHLQSYIPDWQPEPSVVYLDALIIFNKKVDYLQHKEQLKEFEE